VSLFQRPPPPLDCTWSALLSHYICISSFTDRPPPRLHMNRTLVSLHLYIFLHRSPLALDCACSALLTHYICISSFTDPPPPRLHMIRTLDSLHLCLSFSQMTLILHMISILDMPDKHYICYSSFTDHPSQTKLHMISTPFLKQINATYVPLLSFTTYSIHMISKP
jgi:hypothetical protein